MFTCCGAPPAGVITMAPLYVAGGSLPASMTAVIVVGAAPSVGLTDSQVPVEVLAEAVKRTPDVVLFTTMDCRTVVKLLDAIRLTAIDPGLTMIAGAARTVRLTWMTTGPFEACEAMLMELLYEPGASAAKLATPMVMLPGVVPYRALLATSQLAPESVAV